MGDPIGPSPILSFLGISKAHFLFFKDGHPIVAGSHTLPEH